MDKALCQACLANIYSADNQELDRLDLISSNFFLLSWYCVTLADFRASSGLEFLEVDHPNLHLRRKTAQD